MTVIGYFNESATAKCPAKDYFSFLQWMLDVPNLVKILCTSKQNIKKKRDTIAFQTHLP